MFSPLIAQMEPRLPELFTLLPKSPVRVEPIPDFQAAAATHYMVGTPNGKRPGRVVVATSNFATRSLVDDEAVAYHEGVPGHHMQLSVLQQLTGLPKFRLHNLGFNAYSEGGRCTPSKLVRKSAFSRIQFRIMAGCPPNCFARYVWWSIRHPREGMESRSGRGIPAQVRRD